VNTWFRGVSWIITLSELSTVRHNQGQKASQMRGQKRIWVFQMTCVVIMTMDVRMI
jgi:hypothetical protein